MLAILSKGSINVYGTHKALLLYLVDNRTITVYIKPVNYIVINVRLFIKPTLFHRSRVVSVSIPHSMAFKLSIYCGRLAGNQLSTQK